MTARKCVILAVCVLGLLASPAYAQVENWTSMGFLFSNSFELDPDYGMRYLISHGAIARSYTFFDGRQMGVFLGGGLFALGKNDGGRQIEFTAGPGLRFPVNRDVDFHIGFGFNAQLWSWQFSQDPITHKADRKLSLGLGADIGIKHDIGESMFFNFGATLRYHFVAHRNLRETDDNWENALQHSNSWISDYRQVAVSPYIAIGFNFWGERMKWGRPPKEESQSSNENISQTQNTTRGLTITVETLYEDELEREPLQQRPWPPLDNE